MRKRFTPLALLFGLLTAMLLGSTGVAQATTLLPTLTACTQGVVNVNVVTCNDFLNTVKVVIIEPSAHVLTGTEITAVKNSLNNNNIDIDVANINVAKNQVANIYKNTLNLNSTITPVAVICIASICY